MDDPDHRLYEDAFMKYTLILLNVMVLIIGFCTMAFENVLYVGIAQGCSMTCKKCRNFGHDKCHKCKRSIRKVNKTVTPLKT